MKKCFPQSLLPAGVLSAILALSPAAVDAGLTGYLHIDDIPGESQRVDHEDEIDIHDIVWRIESTSDTTRTRRRSVVKPLIVSKKVDKSSPYLALASLQGRNLGRVVLTVRKDSGEAHLDYLVITMENVLVTSYEVNSENSEENPDEKVGLTFDKITYKYTQQADDHSAGDEHEIEYDIAAGV